MGNNEYLTVAKQGINSVDLKDEYKQMTLANLKKWLADDPEFAEYQPQIIAWIENEKWETIIDAFFQVIPFGTGGRRGLVGIGPNRINSWTIRNSAQGHSQYLLNNHSDASERGIVVAYGVRVFLDGSDYDASKPNPVLGLSAERLAHTAAEIYAANGIKVHIYRDYKTTPELSFAVRRLNCIGGVMIDASHNQPSDCGKKVFDAHGGQLIPPFDQALTDEVTENVVSIKSVPFGEAEKSGIISYIDESISDDYHRAVLDLALTEFRDIDIVYSPLHGPGLSSIYPVLIKGGFRVKLDPQTKNLSGKFENVKFNIPNPEVEQSFEGALDFASTKNADVILNSDPDADRIGIMVRHKNEWRYLNGNEIGIVLTNFAIDKKRVKQGVIVKTDVTTGLIGKIAADNGIECIGDLLVGFKYVAEIMNRLEREGRIGDFIFGGEESHGYIAGDYARDKDAAMAALWLCELAAELKNGSKTIVDYLDDIYCRYGYYRNYLTEIRMLGAEGLDKINQIQKNLRENIPGNFGDYPVASMIDRWDGEPFASKTDKSSRNVLVFRLPDIDGRKVRVTVRPSGTEPKTKFYIEIGCPPCRKEELSGIKSGAERLRKEIERAVLGYCYRLIGVDFPERGYLLFWQLPLKQKLRYFEIEEDIAVLKGVGNKDDRKDKLAMMLKFLGSDPIGKVNKAFTEKYGISIEKYLDI